MCMRLPVPNDDDMQWMRSGQPLSSLIAEAYEEQRAKARAEAEGVPYPGKEPAAAEDDGEPKDAVESMNSTLDDLEKLFGFTEEPEAEAAPEPEPKAEEEYDPLVADDTKIEPLMYHYKDADYLITAHKDMTILFCPFCGSKLALTAKDA